VATLTLKKPKALGDSNLYKFCGNFVVMRHARNSHSFRFVMAHETKELATKEALRLVSENKTEKFLVLEIVDSVEWSEQ